MNKYIRKDLINYTPYKAHNIENKYKLDANESPYNLTENVRKSLINWLNTEENLNIYPDTDSTLLRESLADFYGVMKENITCGVGSDQIIDYITKVFLENGDIVVTPTPTFSMYSLTTKINRGNVVEVGLNEDFSVNEDLIIKSAKDNNAKIVFLCTPNNPTGNSMSVEQIIKVVENVNGIVVVDEAYGEFCDISMIDYINKYDNMIILRTFSKAFGLAGARIGYAIGAKTIIDTIDIVRAPYNLSTLSQILAIETLKDSKEYQKRIISLINEKNYLQEEVKDLSFIKLVASDANFVYIECDFDLHSILLKNGVLVRKLTSNTGQKLRISVGTREQNEFVVNILKNINN